MNRELTARSEKSRRAGETTDLRCGQAEGAYGSPERLTSIPTAPTPQNEDEIFVFRGGGEDCPLTIYLFNSPILRFLTGGNKKYIGTVGLIISDFDGVVVRSRFPDKKFIWSTHLERDLGLPLEVQRELFALPLWQEIIVGKYAFDAHLRGVFTHYGVPVTPATFIEYWLSMDLNWYDDVLSLFADLKNEGHIIYLATNQDKIRASYLRRLPQVSSVFSQLFASSDFGFAKRDSQYFSALQKALGSQQGPVVFIDDALANIHVANEIGFSGIHFDPDLDRTATVSNLRVALLQVLS